MAEKTIIGAGGMLRARAPYGEFEDIVGDATGPVTLTLPSSGQYSGEELRVEFNGQILTQGEDYTFVGVAPRTQIQYQDDVKAGDRFRYFKVHNP